MICYISLIRYDAVIKDPNVGDYYSTHNGVDEYSEDYIDYPKNPIESLKRQLDVQEMINALSNQSVSF